MKNRDNYGVIIHPEDFEDFLQKMTDEEAGIVCKNMIRVFIGEPTQMVNERYVDVMTSKLCGRVAREKQTSENRSIAGALGGKAKANKKQNDSKSVAKGKQNDSKSVAYDQQNGSSNNQIPNTNNQIPNTNIKEYFADDVVSYLNYKTGKHFKLTDKTVSLINARVKEGYTTEDFKKVIDKKCAEWMGTPYEKYLQPATLFAPSHFDNYLNQPDEPKQTDMFAAFLNGGTNDEGRVYPNSDDVESGIYRSTVYPE